MNLLPLHINLSNKPCLVVGGGEVAARKIELLLRVGAVITIVSPEVCASIDAWVKKNQLTLEKRVFAEQDINRQALIIAATNNQHVNHQIADLARIQNIPVNVVDDPSACSVIFPSIVDRSPLVVSVSTNGTSPVLARFVRTTLESVIPHSYSDVAQLLEKYRSQIRAAYPEITQRRRFIESCLDGSVAEHAHAHRADQAEALLLKLLSEDCFDSKQGELYIVNITSDDPDLLTFRALRLMQQADVVFYHDNVNDKILDLVRRDAQKNMANHLSNNQLVECFTKEVTSQKRVLFLQSNYVNNQFLAGLEESHILFQYV